MPDRLKRLDVVYQHSPIYFVTACTANRQNLLATEAIHTAFKSFAGSDPTYGAWVGAYALMPLRTADHIPPYWQKGFFDRVLRSSES